MTPWHVFCALHFAEIVVLGPKCEQAECLGLVAAVAHWPSGAVRLCERHTAWLRRIADAMGVHLVVDQFSFTPPGLDDAEQRFSLMELDGQPQ